MKCPSCGNTEDFVRDISNANNDLVCNKCGMVFEDNPIVSEVTFGESSSGAAVVHGSFIGVGQSHGGSGALESREQTLNNARRKLRAVSYALRIPEYITDAAFQWYKLCLTHNFVQGRKSQNVISACLYVACRKEKTHHMLIDFSSRLQISVYSIGSTFLKMCKHLHITDLPLVDPSLYIQHFAEKLDLSDKKNKVIKDAVKLAQRMSKDWMHEGRRPAGIAGACLLLACRMNNLRRTHSEIVAVSHVGEDTIQTRLNEFKSTQAAQLTIKDFRDNGADVESSKELPPSLKKNIKKSDKLQKNFKSFMSTDEETLKKDPIIQQLLNEQELSSKEMLFYLKKLQQLRTDTVSRIKKTHGIDDENVLISSTAPAPNGSSSQTRISDEDENADQTVSTSHSVDDTNVDNALKKSDASEIDGYDINTDPYRPKNLHLLPTTDTLLSKVSDDPENLDDVDEEDLEDFILDEEASKLKERIWIGLNGEYLLEQESKRLKQEADIISGHANAMGENGTNGKKAKKKKMKRENSISGNGSFPPNVPDAASKRDPLGKFLSGGGEIDSKGNFQLLVSKNTLSKIDEDGNLAAGTTADSVKTMLQGNSSFSKKINYDAIDNLFG